MSKITVIVTTYNRPVLLRETIQGILDQTYTGFELIVVDNNSNYDFFSLINEFQDSRLKCFQNPNGGVIAVNRNYGIKKAKSEFLAFCDDDDVWLPEKLERQLEFLSKHKVDLVYSNTYALHENKELKKTNHSAIDSINKLILGNSITLSSVLVRSSAMVLFNEDRTYGGIEDYTLWISLKLSKYSFGMVEKPLVKYRVLSSSFSRLNKAKGEQQIITLFVFLLKEFNFEWTTKMLIAYRILKSYIKFMIFKLFKR